MVRAVQTLSCGRRRHFHSGPQGRRRTAWVAVIGMVVAPAGCSSSHKAKSSVSITVDPHSSALDQPVTITIRGLGPRQGAEVKIASTDFQGRRWAGHASFTADTTGTIDLARAAASAGTYRGVRPMGLIESLQPQSGPSERSYFRGARPMAFTITVSTAGTVRRSVTAQRELGAQVTSTQATPERDGFVGALWTPTASSGPKPAVVVIGGSEGGLGSPLLSAVLASHGYPTLNIAYFRAPSLPGSLQAIPIEYFARAVD